MDIVLVFNGLGNQMSQYTFYLAKKKYVQNIKCVFYKSNANHNGFELNKLFNVEKIETGFYSKVFSILNRRNICSLGLRKILSLLNIIKIYRENIESYDFDETYLFKGRGLINYYWGGWHSYKYVDIVKNDVKKLYTFNENIIDYKNLMVAKEMQKSNSVSFHIRRGDYLKKENSAWGKVVSDAYYLNVLEKIGTIKDLKFYIFSDDIEWCKKNLNIKNIIFINWNNGAESWKDMYLISKCKINVNPNSTFSWWASWINSYENKIVFVPDRFIYSHKSVDFYPPDWKQIPVL